MRVIPWVAMSCQIEYTSYVLADYFRNQSDDAWCQCVMAGQARPQEFQSNVLSKPQFY